jgi:hypothetical protein
VWDWALFVQQVVANLVSFGPVELAIAWLIFTTRTSARRASAMAELLPVDLTELQRKAVAWWIRKSMTGLVADYVTEVAAGTDKE